MCPGLTKYYNTVWNPIGPQQYTELSYPPSPATNDDTTTGTGTAVDIVLTGYLKLFLFFKDDANKELLLSF